eukprot:CAMPEP_0181291440 /NCGR_PEP_ID=MMETSP1101-20121128/1967_1 /TAXON_ID=46948 /ORGANISM="Rhodomonas abbreviata, Strain Caron Lab Isolate" /LENGTH=361 /DNA_ID=CAMNT_0023395829 /DNA_START=336 /DNA_END=1418 /DNA_ORIENTATION=+
MSFQNEDDFGRNHPNSIWLDACIGSWQNDVLPVQSFLNSGGNRSRRLLDGEAATLNQQFPGAFSPGLDLINIALHSASQDVLRLFLPPEAMEPAPVDLKKLWLEACRACMNSDVTPVLRFLEEGGSPNRRLLESEAKELCRTLPDCFLEGETLANLALKWDNEAVLSVVLESVDKDGTGGKEGKETANTLVEHSSPPAPPPNNYPGPTNSHAQDVFAIISNRTRSPEPLVAVHNDLLVHDEHLPFIAADNRAIRREEAGVNRQSLWRQACVGAYENSSNPIVAFLEAGGDRCRRLTAPEVQSLGMPGAFHAGETLADIALRRDSGKALAAAVSDVVPPPKRLCGRGPRVMLDGREESEALG